MAEPKITTAIRTMDGRVLIENDDGTYSPAKDETDWERVENMTDEEITANAMSDPDCPVWTDEEWEAAIKKMKIPRKKSIHIKVDEDVLEWFKSFGRGYQTRMNAVLRAFVRREKFIKKS